MHDYSFYSGILGLSSGWRIADVTIDEQSGDIELHIRSRRGNTFSCAKCGATILPTGERKARWLHENNLNIRFYISALIPVVSCKCCGDMIVNVPWKHIGEPFEEHHLDDTNRDATDTSRQPDQQCSH